MSRRVALYISATALVAVMLGAGWLVIEPPRADWPWLGVLLMLGICCVLESRSAVMPGGQPVSIATIPHLAGAFLLPAPLAMAAAAVGILFDLVRLRQPLQRVVFNVSNTAITVGITALVAMLLDARGGALVDGGFDDVVRFFIIVLVYYGVNSLLLSGIVALSRGEPLAPVFWSFARGSAPAEVAVSVIGGLAVFVWLTNRAWVAAVVFPMLIAQLTLDYLAANALKGRELEYQAFHDALTGLPNRMAMQRKLALAVQHAAQPGQHMGMLMVDLDGFKDVNDTFGHAYGDALLREVASRFLRVVSERGMVARLGGDEFAVLLPTSDLGQAQQVADELLAILSTPITTEDVELFVSASIGLAISPEHGSDPDVLLRRADIAMYAAKNNRQGLVIYGSELDSHHPDRLALLHDLRLALNARDGQLWLAYQPKVCARTGELESVEALLRWNHPTRGAVPPVDFIQLAEQAGLSAPLTQWVLSAASAQCRAWQDQQQRIRVCVNVSMYDLRDETFPDMVAEQLATHGADPQLFGVEMTESAAMADPTRTRAVLDRLRGMGVRISIDDFGTGYSSLAYLTGLPVDELKIDRSFVVGMRSSAQHAAIVRSTISLGHDLDLVVVAEGVEDEGAWGRLRSYGCDVIQGHYVSPPLGASALLRWLQEETAAIPQAPLAA